MCEVHGIQFMLKKGWLLLNCHQSRAVNGDLEVSSLGIKISSHLDCYTVLQICSTPTFPIFNLSGFERELLKLHKQMISHFVALDVGYIICQVQLCNCIRGCHATFLLKNTLFKQEVAWQPLRERQGCSPSMLGPHIRAFKWSIVCFSTISPCEDISGYVQKCWFY